MTTFENHNTPQQQAEQLVAHYEGTLSRGVEIGYPERVGENPEEVFPRPTTPRAEASAPGWVEEQEQAMRAIGAEFGYGRETDRTLGELGLGGAHVYYEPGKPWKDEAEVALVEQDAQAQPASHVFGGNPNRDIGADEKEYVELRFGLTAQTEYEVSRIVAEHMPGFTAHADGERVLPLSYDIHSNFAVGQEPTGQFVEIGRVGEVPVVLLRIDRENYVDDHGANKYRKQPGAGDIVKIMSQATAKDITKPIAFVTSATYQASREVDVFGAGLATGRQVGVPTYGTARLAEVRGEDVPAPAPINQLPGELHVAAQNVVKLKGAIG